MIDNFEDILNLSDEEFEQKMGQIDAQVDNVLDGSYTAPIDEEQDNVDEDKDESQSTESDTDINQQEEDVDTEKEFDEQTTELDFDENTNEEESQQVEGETSTYQDGADSTDREDATLDTKKDSDDDVDYKEAYERILAPFKANGKTIKVDNTDDAIKLMQMGANYNHKMAAIKPHLKIVKTLEANGLLDEVKVNHLIDAAKGNKGALGKLLKDSGIDSYDIGSETVDDYIPTNHTISNEDYNLSEVLDNIRSTDGYETTSKVISETWDDASRSEMYQNPSIIDTIHNHVQSGIYHKVQERVDNLKALGKIPSNVSDVNAYGTIFGQMLEAGEFNEPTSDQTNNEPDSRKTGDAAKRKQKRKAAAPTKKRASERKAQLTPNDILNMPDDEIEKLSDTALFKTI